MITKKEKKAILKAIGKNHISKIHDYAVESGCTKENGDAYSKSTFSMVLNGHLPLPEVEKIIFDASEYFLEEAEKERKRREDFMKRVNKK